MKKITALGFSLFLTPVVGLANTLPQAAKSVSDVTIQNQTQLRSLFKNVSAQALPSGAKPVKLGLSSQQIDGIEKLTQGRVDFSVYHSVTHRADELSNFKSKPGYLTTTYPGVMPPVLSGEAIEPDPELQGEYWIAGINAENVSATATGEGVVIANCDAGYYTQEPDIAANLLLEHAYDLSDKDQPFEVADGNFQSHGTSVTAIMAGVLDGEGTNGIAFDSKVVPLQNFNYNSNDDLDKEVATARCVLRAITIQGVNIIVLENQTFSGSSETFEPTRQAVRLAISSGIHVVSAAGNAGLELQAEAEDDTGSIIVGALSVNGDRAGFSNFGDRITVGAFGEQLWTLSGPDGSFSDFGGTSGATPQVAAAVALMLEVNPELDPQRVREILVESRSMEATNEAVGGILDVKSALQLAQESLSGASDRRMAQENFRQQLTSILNRAL